MHFTKYHAIALLCALAPAAQAQGYPHEYDISGFVLQAEAYKDKVYAPKEQSRYKFSIVQMPKGSAHWDFTLDDDPDFHLAHDVTGAVSPIPYGRNRLMTIHATLHEYDTYEEQVTFHDLDLGASSSDLIARTMPCRYLALKKPVTATTPSGITITLPTQGEDTVAELFRGPFEGNFNALFLRIETTPSQKLVVLPQSSLYKKYPEQVSIALDCPAPNYMVWYTADNTFTKIAVGLPNLKIVTHLDTLTLIVRQRVDLKSVPVTLTVPIDRSVHK
jgi:hypothetical protein